YVFGREGVDILIPRVKHRQGPRRGYHTRASTGAECLVVYWAYIWQRLEKRCCGWGGYLS
ncbi:hypothetical protein HOY80DRAFT_912862, partial [Tuber brumale]